ncbi:DUF2793 domain-containing protein [Sphingorhabdus arenilitoris]|uniref:DUF2793 domain-containing protein n=1 Tax=Sphingorhabdus arenilitoris TaxID=1490041 RepID=A0ABV8RGY8_9SPHN
MMQMNTARHKMPLIFAGQAQKELTHNEALAIIDALISPAVLDEIAAPVSNLGAGDAGKCWLVAPLAQGAWAGHDRKIAYWTGGSFRFLEPHEGMTVWQKAQSVFFVYQAGAWVSPAYIADISGGNVVDIEARAAVNLILAGLREVGIIAR